MKFYLLSVILFSFLAGYSQNKIVRFSYKVSSTEHTEVKDEIPGQIGNFFFNNLVYTFESNKDLCYLVNVEKPGLKNLESNIKGETKIFINFRNNLAHFKEDFSDKIKFKKLDFYKTQNQISILNQRATEYLSKDSSLSVFVSNKINWLIQPCLFTTNQLKGGILKLINRKSNFTMELVQYNLVKHNLQFKKNLTRCAKDFANKESFEMICPFFSE